jgi:predicted RNA-binding Zn ribbon-like protein
MEQTRYLPVDDYQFDLSGGRLCLAFANTAGSTAEERKERLTSYARLVSWAQQAGLIDAAEADRLRETAADRPAEAAAALERARAVRNAIQRLFLDVANRRPADLASLETFNGALREAADRSRLVPADGRFAWAPADPDGLDRMLPPVVRSAAELLTSADLATLRECGSDTCLWLFLDTSRNRSRRWCDMKSCGNRMKVRRHRERRRVGR